jgi:hypothetical protein
VGQRKHISWKTKCAAALLQLRGVPYDDAKQMTEDQFLSLFHWDHNILHSSEHEDRDRFWNLTPMLIAAHREKTKTDAKIIAKGKRIRRKGPQFLQVSAETRREIGNDKVLAEVARAAYQQGLQQSKIESWQTGRGLAFFKPAIRSRGFDKRYRKKMDGTVVKR